MAAVSAVDLCICDFLLELLVDDGIESPLLCFLGVRQRLGFVEDRLRCWLLCS
jgi:hypothetical protein